MASIVSQQALPISTPRPSHQTRSKSGCLTCKAKHVRPLSLSCSHFHARAQSSNHLAQSVPYSLLTAPSLSDPNPVEMRRDAPDVQAMRRQGPRLRRIRGRRPVDVQAPHLPAAGRAILAHPIEGLRRHNHRRNPRRSAKTDRQDKKAVVLIPREPTKGLPGLPAEPATTTI